MNKFPHEIKAGDRFVHDGKLVWTALHDAEVKGAEVHIDVVHYPDGGASTRVWEDGGSVIPVEPAESNDGPPALKKLFNPTR